MRKVIFYLLKIWLNVDDCQGLSKINQTMRKQSYKKYISQGSLYTKKKQKLESSEFIKTMWISITKIAYFYVLVNFKK